MKTIKFRAWANEKLEYDIIWPYIEDVPLQEFFNDERFKLMQYTGLKDKNGKEIFEGDIVHLSLPGFGIEKDITIEWEGNGYGAVMEDYHREVIGNIYENKELLK